MKEKLEETIIQIVREVLSEMANPNLKFREFAADMQKMGFTVREAKGSAKVFYIPEYGDCSNVTVHTHNNGADIDPEAFRITKSVLNKIGWFRNPQNVNRFPFAKWKVSKEGIDVDTTTSDIESANRQFLNVEVIPVFQMKDSVCVLKTPNGVNLCRSSNDRRPLLDTWFEKFAYDRKTEQIPCLKRDNYETMETEAFPINVDGTLDTKNVIIENKNYGKSSNKRNRRLLF